MSKRFTVSAIASARTAKRREVTCGGRKRGKGRRRTAALREAQARAKRQPGRAQPQEKRAASRDRRYSKHFGRECMKRVVSILVLAFFCISCAEDRERT